MKRSANYAAQQRDFQTAAVAFATTASASVWMDHLPDISPPENFLHFTPTPWDNSILSGSLDELSLNNGPSDNHMLLDGLATDAFAPPPEVENSGAEPQRKRAREEEAERSKAINEASLETYLAGLASDSTEGVKKAEGAGDDDDLGKDASMSLGRPDLDRRKSDKADSMHVARGNKAQRERQRRERLNERYMLCQLLLDLAFSILGGYLHRPNPLVDETSLIYCVEDEELALISRT